MDEGQHIVYDRKFKKMEGAHLDSSRYYPWERAVFGGSFLPAWHSVQPQNEYRLQYSRRFGQIMCLFLRETSAEYSGESSSVWSPLDSGAWYDFTAAERASVPDTYLRFIM